MYSLSIWNTSLSEEELNGHDFCIKKKKEDQLESNAIDGLGHSERLVLFFPHEWHLLYKPAQLVVHFNLFQFHNICCSESVHMVLTEDSPVGDVVEGTQDDITLRRGLLEWRAEVGLGLGGK